MVCIQKTEQQTPSKATMFLGLRSAIYPVNDLDQAKRWYAQALATAPYFDQPFYVGFAVGGFELGLIPDGDAGTSGPQPLWGVTSASDAITHLLAIGATELEPVADVGEGIKVGAVMSPFGNRLGVIENASFDASAMR